MQARDLLGLSARELRAVFSGGHDVDPRALDDTEYRGVSLGLPTFFERLTWKKFKKAFHRDRGTGLLRGWNQRLEQNDLDGPCIPLLRGGRPVTFGHFHVVDPTGRSMPVPGRPALLLDYGLGENAALDFTRFVRDPIVAVNAGDARLLLGTMYLEIGPLRIPTPSFFTLELDGKLTDVVAPPRRKPARSR